MSTCAVPRQAGQAHGWVTLGSHWLWPATLATMFVALYYVPGHNPSSTGSDDLLLTIVAVYVIGLSVVGVRLVRGTILRAVGSRAPIVLLGCGADPLVSDALLPRWRLAALAVGAIASAVVAVAAAQLAASANPTTNVHAIAGLVLGVNAVIAVSVLVPAPGLSGWALLLGIIDAAGVPLDQRVRRAARVAQLVGVADLLAAGAVAAMFRNPMLMLLGFLLGFATWRGSKVAVSVDVTVRFLASHAAGDLARPVASHAGPEEPLDDLVARLRTENTVVSVESSGGVVGAIGPRQLSALGSGNQRARCTQVMVPLGSLRVLGPAASSAELLTEIARHGFALVAGPDGLGHVEAADLGRQIGIWVALGNRGVGRGSR